MSVEVLILGGYHWRLPIHRTTSVAEFLLSSKTHVLPRFVVAKPLINKIENAIQLTTPTKEAQRSPEKRSDS